VSVLADYFLICSGTNTTQVKTLAEEIEDKLAALGVEPRRTEGAQTGTWIILDYSGVVIHIFHRETRSFYNLERLWSDGAAVDLTAITGENGNESGAEPTGGI
jgi:ribosome-associated protein